MDRRQLIRNLAAGTASVIVLPLVAASCEKESPDPDPQPGEEDGRLIIDLTEAKYAALLGAGGAVIEQQIIIFNAGDGYRALSAQCTHQGCQVSYDHDAGQLPCPCHGSAFSLSGTVLEGPADAPLTKHPLEQDGDLLKITIS